MSPTDRLAQLLALLESDPEDAFCLYGVAQEHASRGDHDAAVGWYERAAAADPADGYIHYHRARSLEALDRRDDAIAAVRAGLDAAARGGDAHARAELSALLDELGG
jgi:tetratricopeptide (TPR) repeat protein